ILEGDDSLSGEMLDQLDLLVGEGTNFLTKDDDDSNKLIVLEHRHANCGPSPAEFNCSDGHRMTFGINSCRCNVGDLDRLLRSDHSAKKTIWGRLERTALELYLDMSRRHIVARDNAQCTSFMEIEVGEIGLADARRIGQHRVEYRFQLARRT